ncbi:MAG TPA: S46 family peptidase [Thermoanaerobaculia bacterium]|nr:S46 family peptidase [Thermoanaerobaculia bacterium]
MFRTALTFAFSFFLTLPALADEGMWMPQQMPELATELRAAGIRIDAAQLADLTGDPMGAVVSLGGCTASFVSPDGLVVTNHHCAFGSIQHNSTAERDLITDGFLAKTRAEELPAAPGTKVWVTTNIEDVTARVTAGMKAGIGDAERSKFLDRREKELVAECEKAGGVRCRVSGFFEGSQYLRLTQAEISDVRLVYAPPRAIGEFGGEVDNFEWPRHTGDFSFYRAYVNGQPFHPKHWLRIAAEGVKPGDAVLVAGYPGRTFRYKTADEVRNYQEFVYPANIRYFSEVIHLLEESGRNNRDVQIRNSSRIKSLANSLKNYTSVNEGFVKDRILEARLTREARMREAMKDPALAKYASAFAEIEKINAARLRTRERDLVLDWIAGRGSPMVAQAVTAVRLASEKTKKDIDRLSKYQEREWPTLLNASARAQRTMDVASDRAVLKYFLQEAAALPKTQRIAALDDAVAKAGGVDAYLDKLYANTKVGSEDERKKMLGETTAQLQARKDSMLELAASLVPLFEAREEEELAATGAMARLRPGYFEVLRKVSGGTLYPDANSTLRITIGRVEGYSPKDATSYTPLTSLAGVVEKESGKEPFANPPALLAAAKDPAKTKPYAIPELGDVPVNFLSTCDTTGGNSGSPTLNAKGELVGLLFDGNYESIDADFLFNPKVTRSIHVDSRYMLWVMDAVDGAHELMRELGVEPKTK